MCGLSAEEERNVTKSEVYEWLMSGGLKTYPLGVDYSKIFTIRDSVKQPVKKEEKPECERAERELQAIASSLDSDNIVVFTNGSRLPKIKPDKEQEENFLRVPQTCGAGCVIHELAKVINSGDDQNIAFSDYDQIVGKLTAIEKALAWLQGHCHDSDGDRDDEKRACRFVHVFTDRSRRSHKILPSNTAHGKTCSATASF